MRKLVVLWLVGLCGVMQLWAQDSPELAAAKALDKEIEKLNDLPDEARPGVIHEMTARIRQQPKKYAVALACNLAISATEASRRTTLQEVADLLADTIRDAPANDAAGFDTLAGIAHYQAVRVSMRDPRYTAQLAKLEAIDRAREAGGFTLADLRGQEWNLKNLRGKVVVVNFWATWCPPCRRELPDLESLYDDFQTRGLVVLGITGEEAPTVRTFVAKEKIGYPVLLDSGDKVRKAFQVDGIPVSLVFDREGRLVASAVDRPTREGFLEMIGKAGLR